MKEKFVVLKNFINTKYLLSIADKTEAYPSKVGKKVDFTKKRRKDQLLTDDNCNFFDKQIFRKCKKAIFHNFFLNVTYREPWKICFYSSDDKGYYNSHTDTQGNFNHRNVSMVLCLTEKKI